MFSFKVISVFKYGWYRAAVWYICPEYLHMLANLKSCYGISFTPIYAENESKTNHDKQKSHQLWTASLLWFIYKNFKISLVELVSKDNFTQKPDNFYPCTAHGKTKHCLQWLVFELLHPGYSAWAQSFR